MSDTVEFIELACSNNEHKIGVATLDNPSSLNALSFDMLVSLKDKLELWHNDESIICVVIQGSGEKAFCAGGDIRTMYNVMRDTDDEQTQEFCTTFFTVEYQCDYLIHTYSKPVIAWGEGIVMGGGMGLFMASSHRVVTPKSRLAMPEISIGLYPDVGGTYFLNRLNHNIGMFLGMTGIMVNASDAKELKMANHLLLSEDKPALVEQLQMVDWNTCIDSYEAVSDLLETMETNVADKMPEHQLLPFIESIESACRPDGIENVVHRILTLDIREPWFETAKSNLLSGSPITVHICYRQLTQLENLSLADCFRTELNLSVRSSLLGEFQEGVRARLIDKDGTPNWKFSNVSEVDKKMIDQMFTPLWDKEAHPLSQLGQF